MPETILLVDDDANFLRAISRFLRAEGYAIVMAETPMEALQKLIQSPDRVDLLLTDLKMQEDHRAGLELVRAARRIKPELPVILNSSAAALPAKKIMLQRELEAMGGGIVLSKTEGIEGYVRVIKTLFDRSQPR